MTTNNAINVTGAGLVKYDGAGTFSAVTVTNHSVLVGASSNGITSIALTNGQLAIGSTGADPVAAGITAGSGITVTPGAGSITIAATASSSFVVQQVRTSTVSASTNSTTIPFDDTIPQNTEGTELMTRAITPTNSNSVLVIECVVVGTIPAGTIGSICLFQDSTASALAVTTFSTVSSELWETWRLTYYMTAGTTSSTTFKIRVGANSGNFYVNSNSTGRKFGGALFTSLIVTEYTS